MAARRRTALALTAAATAVALAVAGCSDDGSDGPDGSGTDARTIDCESGTVGPGASSTDRAARITGYDADLTVADEGGGLTAHETITVEYDDSQHAGIVRDFDDDEITVTEVSGKVDGRASGQAGPGPSGTRLTIGDPDATLDAGEHVFDIDYAAGSVLEPATDVDQDWQLEQTVIGSGWTMDIAHAEVRIELPEGTSGDVSCTVGPGASAHVDGVGTSTLVLTADDVPAGSGVRVVAGTDVDPYEGSTATP